MGSTVRDVGGREASFADLLDEIARRRDNFPANKKIDREVVDLMKQVGVYRTLVAHRFGLAPQS